MLLSDDQRSWLLDFINDPHNSDRNKITFMLHYFVGKGMLHEFADHVGSNYALRVPPEEALNWFQSLKEENAHTDTQAEVEQEEGEDGFWLGEESKEPITQPAHLREGAVAGSSAVE